MLFQLPRRERNGEHVLQRKVGGKEDHKDIKEKRELKGKSWKVELKK